MKDLSVKNQDNIEYMIEAIKTKLRMASGAAMSASAFHIDRYDDILDVYEVVMSKDRLSISEVEAIAKELGNLRNK